MVTSFFFFPPLLVPIIGFLVPLLIVIFFLRFVDEDIID